MIRVRLRPTESRFLADPKKNGFNGLPALPIRIADNVKQSYVDLRSRTASFEPRQG
jgi:hypothetical protein